MASSLDDIRGTLQGMTHVHDSVEALVQSKDNHRKEIEERINRYRFREEEGQSSLEYLSPHRIGSDRYVKRDRA